MNLRRALQPRAPRSRPAPRRPARARDRGQVLVLFALSAVILLAGAGLAIDVGRFYSERRFLQNAADAAALAAANALIRGESDANADAAARDVLTRNFGVDPNGVTPTLPPVTPVYEAGHAGDPLYLSNGILITGGDVRVAVANSIPYVFGGVVGLGSNQIGARARVNLNGNLLPIAVRRYVNAPGPQSGATSPCPGNQGQFMDFFATADTSCLGTDADAVLRTNPGPGAAFDAVTPGGDPANHGPVVAILGQGAQPSNGADFRGFVALDIRNFATDVSQLYYNKVTSGTTSNTLKAMEANWILNGGYPGPKFPSIVSPPDPNDQIAIMSGNATGIAIDAVNSRFAPGKEILVLVYSGQTMAIPDFTISPPGTIVLPTSGLTASAGSFKVSRNQAFTGAVDLSTLSDALDAQNPMNTGSLLGGASPFTYSPNPVTPSIGSGTSVSMQNATTSGAPTGIYTLWVQGQAGSPYLTTKLEPFALQIGSVSRDFTLTSDSRQQTVASPGDTATFTLNLKRSGPPFDGTVTLSADTPLPTGAGAVSFSANGVTPTPGSGTDVTLTINTGTMAPGQHSFVIRATGMNGDTPSVPVTHLLPLTIYVGTSSSGGNQEYVDITGFAVMRIASTNTNTVEAYAISPVITDMNDPQLRRGQVARLVPWN
ncbi:MAG: pilus assembly protein TadG-related protein [Chloroflexota bacterium]